MTNQVILAEAVEAAAKAFSETHFMDDALMNALEAAAPHMLAGAWDEAIKLAAEVAWEHDGSASSAVSQMPNPYRPTSAD